MLPGNVISASSYNTMGRVATHGVTSNGQNVRQRKYEWGMNQQLKSITNELNNTKTTFSYDEFSNLVKADYGLGNILHRQNDKVGNLYATSDKSDRIYGKGSRLEQSDINLNEKKSTFQGGHGKLVTKGAEYTYDGEGNLIKKIEAPNPNAWVYGVNMEKVYTNIPTWHYEYYGNGMLKKVTKHNGETVEFKYDSLGRRVEKSSNSKIIKFVWDGNNPLHEWTEGNRAETLTTWVFDEGTFTPSAKLTKHGNYSIISDYLGTPVEAYDSDGKKVWEQELDIYGRVKPRFVKKQWGQVVDDGMFDEFFVPYRFQGQYADSELDGDIYYNRFRWYSPELGQYITQDPIGLAGGNPTLYGYVGDPNSWIDPFGLESDPIEFTSSDGQTFKVTGYTNLSHLSDTELNKIFHSNNNAANGTQLFGSSPKDVHGNVIELHHHQQNPKGPIHGIPRQHHNIGNRGQHPNGNKKGGGLTPQERTDFKKWKQEFWRHQARNEMDSRKKC